MLRTGKQKSFVKIQGLYVCINNSAFAMAWFLLTKTRPFNLHDKAHSSFLRLFPGSFIKVLRVLNIIRKIFIIKYLKINEPNAFFNAPYDGHVIIKTSGGYKVFNFKKKIVATQYNPKLKKETFTKLVRSLEKITYLNISPKIIAIDYPNQCVYEEYINLHKAKKFYPFNNYFYNKIFSTWESNIMLYPFRKVNLKEYVVEQKSLILNKLNYLEKEGYNSDILNRIRKFIELLCTEISVDSHYQNKVYLTLSHGDFHAWNLLVGRKRRVLIDWDTLKERSLYHDLFYIFFHVLFAKQMVNYDEFLVELENCMLNSFLNLQTNSNEFDLAFNNRLFKQYRMLFYLEYIHLDFEKRMDMINNKKQIQRRIGSIDFCIKVFDEVEKEFSKKVS
jgi:thiamine kinase-like enzyme